MRHGSRTSLRLLTAAGALLLGSAVACSDDDEPTTPTPTPPAVVLSRYRAPLVSSEEVPPNASTATGMSDFTLSANKDTLYVNITVANLSNTRFGHFHTGARGVNGGVVADLVLAPTLVGSATGRIGRTFITGANLVGTLAGQPLSALITAMDAGNIYVNLHTDANPGGEIRGQVAKLP